MDIVDGAFDGASNFPAGPADVCAAFMSVAARPGMYFLDDYRQVVAFVVGWSQARPDVFKSLHGWSIARLGGARDKYGWPLALGALAAERTADGDVCNQRTPLVSSFLTLIGEYAAEVEQEGAHERIRNDYETALDRYEAAHERSAHPNGTALNSPQWHEECTAWQERYMPVLRFTRNPRDPWAVDDPLVH